MHELLAAIRPDAVYHLAGWSDVGGLERTAGRPSGPTPRARSTCSRRAWQPTGVDRVLSVSSADVYGKVTVDDLPLTEHAPLRPVSPTRRARWPPTTSGCRPTSATGSTVLRVRAFNHLGPGQTDKFVAPALAVRIAPTSSTAARSLPVGDLPARRDFTDVRDVVRAYRLLIEHGEPGEVYNVCSGVDLAVQELADRLLSLATRPMRFETDPELLRPVEIPVLRGDHGRLKATGWMPEIPMDQTLTDLLEDWRLRLKP